MVDKRKSLQRNIRVPGELWEFVKSQAVHSRGTGLDCSAVIRQWIIEKYENSLKNEAKKSSLTAI